MWTPFAPADQPVVLVVDDDEMVRDMVALALRRAGFTALLAANGPQAVEVYGRHHDGIAAVLLDLQMPGLDGPATLGLLKGINPAVRYCFMSGHLPEDEAAALLSQGAARVFHKPFNLNALTEALRGMTTER
jgi:DNA-binding NtrC family response regulator